MALERLVDELIELLRLHEETAGAALPTLDLALAALAADPPQTRSLEPRALPIAGHLDACSRAMPARRVAQALVASAAMLHWRVNASYTDPQLLASYGYVPLVGPGATHHRHLRVAMGLILLGPRTLYPTHAHPATEVYLPLAGQAEWQAGDAHEPWIERGTDSLIHHPAGVWHAMRTSDMPLLALWLWWGRIEEPARLID